MSDAIALKYTGDSVGEVFTVYDVHNRLVVGSKESVDPAHAYVTVLPPVAQFLTHTGKWEKVGKKPEPEKAEDKPVVEKTEKAEPKK